MNLQDIDGIDVNIIKKLKPKLHRQIQDFCSSLDSDQHPEVVAIIGGEYKTLAPFVKICERLLSRAKNRNEKGARKRLEEAEQIVRNIGMLHGVTKPSDSNQAVPHGHEAGMRARRKFGAAKSESKPEGLGNLVDASKARRTSIEQKIADEKPITVKEALEFLQTGYETFVKRVKNPNPILDGKPEVRIIVCSDGRQPVGQPMENFAVAFKQVAGNSVEPQRDNEAMIIIVGHGGFETGCGAVKAAIKYNSAGQTPKDSSIASITTDVMPVAVTQTENPEIENAIHQAKIAERNSNLEAYALYFDMERRTVVQVYGKRSPRVDLIRESIERSADRDDRDLSTHKVGFVALTREGRRYPGKLVSDAGSNQVFETYFYVDRQGDPHLTNPAKGSINYAVSHTGGVKDSKIILVIDPDPEIAKKAATLVERSVPGVIAVAVHEDWKSGEMKPI